VVAFAWTPLALASPLAGPRSDITMSRGHISRIRTFFSQNGRKAARGAQLQVCIQSSLSPCTCSTSFGADKLSCSAFLRQPLGTISCLSLRQSIWSLEEPLYHNVRASPIAEAPRNPTCRPFPFLLPLRSSAPSSTRVNTLYTPSLPRLSSWRIEQGSVPYRAAGDRRRDCEQGACEDGWTCPISLDDILNLGLPPCKTSTPSTARLYESRLFRRKNKGFSPLLLRSGASLSDH
jgi:hypothetical protein